MRQRKSKSLRKVFVRLPGGKVKVQYKRRRPNKATCAECGAILKGVITQITHKMKHLSKTKKRPSRPYAGKLCSNCMRRKLINTVRGKK